MAYHEIMMYNTEFSHRSYSLRDRFTDESIYVYMNPTEEHFRQKGIDLARSEWCPAFSKALILGFQQEAGIWQLEQAMLVPKWEVRALQNQFQRQPTAPQIANGNQNQNTPPPPKGPKVPNGPKKPKGVKAGAPRKVNEYQGKRFCIMFNDKRGCQKKDCKFTHACNAMLANGQPCGKSSHGYLGHKKEDGATVTW